MWFWVGVLREDWGYSRKPYKVYILVQIQIWYTFRYSPYSMEPRNFIYFEGFDIPAVLLV